MSSMPQNRRGVLIEPATGYRLARHEPAADLAASVDTHWEVEWDLPAGAAHVQGVLPYPCVNLAAGPDGVLVHGPITRREDRVLAGRGHARGTRIRAGAFPGFAGGMQAWRVTDRRATLAEVFGPAGAALACALPDATGPEHRTAVEAFLRERLPDRPDPQAELAGRVVDALLAEPTVARVADVAERFALSPRALQRLFRRYVGLSPKAVLTRSRLHEAVERVAAGEQPRAELALELGYADQAHFTNAFRLGVGRSPGRYGRP
jgi:AraC-like DNA-binding protein